ncbi:MAG: DUF4352 domain-containing protein [Bacillaceae bacterium]|nr:DUF4352 domain-containing protein [Bacillaceae bacterium]
MKKRMVLLLLLLIGGIAVGCGADETPVSSDSAKPASETGGEASGEHSHGKVYTNEDYPKIYATADQHKGARVHLKGQIFLEPERDEDGTYFQMYADPDGMEFNTIVGIQDPDLDVKDGDFVEVEGEIKDLMQGENLMGGKLEVPVVLASSVKVIGYIEAASPTLKKVEVGTTLMQHGYELTLEKIELAEKETRVYVTVTNNSQDTITFYDFNTRAIQGNKQLDGGEMNINADYPEVQSDILPGVESSGIVLFPPFDPKTPVKLLFEGGSENWELNFEPFVFEVDLGK